MSRDVAETPAVLEEISLNTGVPLSRVETIVSRAREVVDELIGDDFSIVAPPLLFATASDPTFAALVQKLKNTSEDESSDCLSWDEDVLAAWLGLDADVVSRHPIATEDDILFRLLESLALTRDGDTSTWPPEVQAEAEEALLVLNAWIDTFSHSRRYRMGSAGLERHFEDWLVDNLGRLKERGYPVRVADRGRQRRLADGRWIPDLICRFTESTGDAQRHDWLVIENKAGAAYLEAADQLEAYVNQVHDELRSGGNERVFGLLIAHGASEAVQTHLESKGLRYVSLASLGYLRKDWQQVDLDAGMSQKLSTTLGRPDATH